MVQRSMYVSFACLLLLVSAVWHFPYAVCDTFSYSIEIRHKQVVFFLVPLENNTYFSINCSTYFNSSIQAYLLTQRPIENGINPAHVNASDTGENKNHTTLSILTNVTQVFYIQINQLDDKSDFLLVNSSHKVTRYYIPFVAGYPLGELFLISALCALGVLEYRKKAR